MQPQGQPSGGWPGQEVCPSPGIRDHGQSVVIEPQLSTNPAINGAAPAAWQVTTEGAMSESPAFSSPPNCRGIVKRSFRSADCVPKRHSTSQAMP